MTQRRPVTVYETKVVSIPRSTTRGEVRQILTEEAEYGKWELKRVRIYTGGDRKVWLRRRILRVNRTLETGLPPV